MNKLKSIGFVLACILIFISSVCAQKEISCKRSELWVSEGSTFFLSNFGKLKDFSGNVIYPSGDAVKVTIEIYKNTFSGKKDITYREVEEIIKSENKIAVCESDDAGRFSITNLPDGFYLFRVGTADLSLGFGPENILVEITKRKGKKKFGDYVRNSNLINGKRQKN